MDNGNCEHHDIARTTLVACFLIFGMCALLMWATIGTSRRLENLEQRVEAHKVNLTQLNEKMRGQ